VSNEEPLAGGNLNPAVAKVGANVHRTAGPWTPAVHQLLDHLAAAKYPAPRVVGVDDSGREILTFVPGRCVEPDYMDLVGTDDAMRRVGALIADYHLAQESFVAPQDAQWREEGRDPSGSSQIIAHNDLAPWNLIVDNDEWTFIDWDLAAPGRKMWDLAWALHSFVGLWPDSTLTSEQIASRIAAFCDGAHLRNQDIPALLDVVIERTSDHAAMLRRRAAAGEEVFIAMVAEGHADVWESGCTFVRSQRTTWLKHLSAPRDNAHS